MYGKSVWWASLLKESCSDVVILPGVTQVEVEEFILTIYGQNTVTDDDTEPFHGFSDAEILAAGGTIRGPTPSSDPSTTMASKQQSSWGSGIRGETNITCEFSTRSGSACQASIKL